ncbi:hypothetical protein BpHYR1_021243 [Brachionus plicatilis]|uniref:Uncharacterized protein n=1 Tax=Brachionus plicatilis TaxID=10195 RepID=A0A3M7T5T0_BRAPC|nr:hypothetical protein BpHYR1_021243 [Brachionus plicatilis]
MKVIRFKWGCIKLNLEIFSLDVQSLFFVFRPCSLLNSELLHFKMSLLYCMMKRGLNFLYICVSNNILGCSDRKIKLKPPSFSTSLSTSLVLVHKIGSKTKNISERCVRTGLSDSVSLAVRLAMDIG